MQPAGTISACIKSFRFASSSFDAFECTTYTHTHSAGAPAILSSCHRRTQFRDRKFVSPIKRYTTCKNRSIALQPVERAAFFCERNRKANKKQHSQNVSMQLCTGQTPYAAVHCVQLVVDLLEQHKRALMLFCPLDAFFHKLDPEKKHNFAHFKDTTGRRLNGAVNSSRWCVKFNHKLKHVQI